MRVVYGDRHLLIELILIEEFRAVVDLKVVLLCDLFQVYGFAEGALLLIGPQFPGTGVGFSREHQHGFSNVVAVFCAGLWALVNLLYILIVRELLLFEKLS